MSRDAFLKSVLDGLTEPVMVIGKDYRVLMANDAAKKNFPPSLTDEASFCYRLSHHRDTPCDGSEHPCPLQACSAAKAPVRVVHEHFNRAGEHRKIELIASPLLDEGGNMLGIVESAHDITEQVLQQEALRENEAKFRQLFNSGNDAIYVYHMLEGWPGPFIEINDQASQMLGYSREELLAMAMRDIDPTESAAEQAEVAGQLMSRHCAIFERVHRTKAGKSIPVEINAHLFLLEDEPAVFAIVRDISERKRAELEYKTAIQTARDGYVVVDSAGRFVDTNDAYCAMLGYGRNELLRMYVPDVEAIESPEEHQRHFAEIRRQGRVLFESRHRCKDGQVIDVEVSATFLDIRGGVLIAFIRNITDRKQTELRIQQLAFYDTLTNLPNRRLLLDRFDKALSQARRFHRSLAVMFLDLDHFKEVNDSLGHVAGDELLVQVSKRFVACIRAGDTVSRSGGDEFVILLAEIRHPQDASSVAEKVIAALDEPISIHGQSVKIGTSIGIALFPVDGGDDMEMLMKKADQAMYEAKALGRGCYRYYRDPEGK